VFLLQKLSDFSHNFHKLPFANCSKLPVQIALAKCVCLLSENSTLLLGADFNGRPAVRRLSELVDSGHAEAVSGVGSQAFDQRTLVNTVCRRRPMLVTYNSRRPFTLYMYI